MDMDSIIITSMVWLFALICLKYYKDGVIKALRSRIRVLEDLARWTKDQKEKL